MLGALLDEPLAELDYAERATRVLAHRVGIWDVLDACRRPGSLDAAIRDARPNDFAALRRAPVLREHLVQALLEQRRIIAEVERILKTHTVPPMEASMARELDRIVEQARSELGR